jgi:hypothetical protein
VCADCGGFLRASQAVADDHEPDRDDADDEQADVLG